MPRTPACCAGWGAIPVTLCSYPHSGRFQTCYPSFLQNRTCLHSPTFPAYSCVQAAYLLGGLPVHWEAGCHPLCLYLPGLPFHFPFRGPVPSLGGFCYFLFPVLGTCLQFVVLPPLLLCHCLLPGRLAVFLLAYAHYLTSLPLTVYHAPLG